jgi:hypothetical protein
MWDLYKMITTLPQKPEQIPVTGPPGKEGKQHPEAIRWMQSYCFQTLKAAYARCNGDDLHLAGDYITQEFPNLGDKTSSSITATTMNCLERFTQGDVGELMAGGETNLSPDDLIDDGLIVSIDTPALKYRESGRFVQLAWKLATYRAVLRRDVATHPRPVVCWADEAQLHVLPSVESMTQAVGRSQRLINVAISQNLPLLISALGSREEAVAWLSNLTTKFLFANSDKDTNEYFSELLGQKRDFLLSGGGGNQEYDFTKDVLGIDEGRGGMGMNEQWLPDLRPEEFYRLRKGGQQNSFLVDFIAFQGGRRFKANGNKRWVKATLKQPI